MTKKVKAEAAAPAAEVTPKKNEKKPKKAVAAVEKTPQIVEKEVKSEVATPTPKKSAKKQKKPATPKTTATAAPSETVVEKNTQKAAVKEDEYVPGALGAALFGGKRPADDSDSSEDSPKKAKMEVQTTIKKKTEKIAEKPQNKKKKVKEAEDEEKEKPTDRVQQRENAKKHKKDEEMSIEEKIVTLFVGNVPIDTSDKEIRAEFEEFGKIVSVRRRGIFAEKATISKKIAVIADRTHVKQSTCLFYIKFADKESVDKALVKDGSWFEKHRLRVDRCDGKKNYDGKITAFIGNLAFDADENELFQFFEQEVGNVSLVRMVRDNESGLGKGFAFVVFKDAASLELALQQNGAEFGGRKIRVGKVEKKLKLKKEKAAAEAAAKKGKGKKGGRFGKGAPGQKGGKRPLNKGGKKGGEEGEKSLSKKVKKTIAKRHRNKQPKSLMT